MKHVHFTLMACIPLVSFAQEEVSPCETIARYASLNTKRQMSQEQKKNFNKAEFCSESYESASSAKKASISGAYKALSGSGSSSVTKIKEAQQSMCSNNLGDHWYEKLNVLEEKNISQPAMDALQTCLSANRAGLSVRTQLNQSENALHITVTPRDRNDVRVSGVTISPTNSAKCKINEDADKLPIQLTAGQPITISCERPPEMLTLNGESVRCFAPLLVTVRTNISNPTVALNRLCETDFLISKAREVEDRIEKIRIEMAKSYADLSKAHSDALPFLIMSRASCPTGYSLLPGQIGMIANNGQIFKRFGNGERAGEHFGKIWYWFHPYLCERILTNQ